MTNSLRIADRNQVMERVLRDTFKPQFNEIAKSISELLRQHLNQYHPKFVAAYSDAETRPYLAMRTIWDIKFNSQLAVTPVYGVECEILDHHRYFTQDKYDKIKSDILVPSDMDDFRINNLALFTKYQLVWSRYTEAQKKLSSMLYSYRSRDKFTKDFPEFAKFLPPARQKIGLPMVVVGDVRKELCDLGICP